MPADTIDINIGSFDLDTTNNIAIEDISYKISKAVKNTDLLKAHGSVIPIGKRTNITAQIKGTIIGTNYDALRTNLDALKAALESTSEYNLTTDDDRFMKVQYRGFSYSYRTMRTFADFSFDLIASDPFWYSNTLSSDTRTPTSAADYTPTSIGGNAATRCKITMTNNSGGAIADNIKFENRTTGEVYQYRGSLANTKVLIVNNRVDTSDLAVTNDGTDDIKNFEGDFITGNVGANTFRYTGTANVSVKIEYRAANY